MRHELPYLPLGSATVTVAMDGDAFDVYNNGPNNFTAIGTGTISATITGTGVGGLGALVAAHGANTNTHISTIILSGDSKIASIGPGSVVTNRSILWVDGPNASIQGNGYNLSVVVNSFDGTVNNAFASLTEMDWIGVGNART